MKKDNQLQTTVTDLKQALAEWESIVVAKPEENVQLDIKNKTQEILKKLVQQIEELEL